MEYKIRIEIDGSPQDFVFKVLTNDMGRIFKVESAGRWHILDKNMLPVAGDMPLEWLRPVADALTELIELKGTE